MAKSKHNCKGCESRYVGCHSECPSYIQYTIDRENELELLRKTNNESFINDNVNEKIRRLEKGYFRKFRY